MSGLLHSIQRSLLLRRLAWRDLHMLAIFLILGFPVAVDLANGFMIQIVSSDFSLGVLYRGSAMLLLLPFVLLLRTFWVKLYLALIVGFWLIENLLWMETTLDYSLIREATVFSKILYAWVIFAYLAYVLPKYHISIEYPMQCMVFFGTIAALSILFSYLTGYGISTYDRSSVFAVKSYFKAQNDIGLAILLSLALCMYFFMQYGKWMYGIYALFMITGLVLLGTRAGLLGGFSLLGAFTFLYILGAADHRKRSGKRLVLVSLMLLTFCGGLYYAIDTISDYRYLYDKYASLLEESPRDTLETAARQRLAERSDLAALLGEGDLSFHIGVLKFHSAQQREGAQFKDFEFGKSVEQDIYDMVGAYGLLLGGLLLTVLLALLLKVVLGFAVAPGFLGFSFTCAFGLFVFHSFVAGHAMGSAAVAAPAGLIYYYAVECTRLPAIGRIFPADFAGFKQ